MLIRLTNIHDQPFYIELQAIVAIQPRGREKHIVQTDVIVGVNTTITMKGTPDEVFDLIVNEAIPKAESAETVLGAPAPAAQEAPRDRRRKVS